MEKIKQMIAESGKMRVAEAVAYVMHRIPDADKKMVTAVAKEVIIESKRYMR